MSRIKLYSAVPPPDSSEGLWRAWYLPAAVLDSARAMDYALDMRELDLLRLADKLRKQAEQSRII